jgi:hypothetical protein
MANWTAENPGEIDSGALATTATTLQTTETSLTEARDTAVTAQGGISDAIWTGEAATAWVSSLSTPIGKINAVVPEMTAVRTAIATYTTTVEDIKTRATSYKETIVQASLTAMVQYLDPVGGPDPTEQALRDQQHQNALNDKATAERLLGELTAERETADAALVSALSSPGGDNWDAQQAALAAIGITSAAGLSPSAIAKGMAEMAAELGNGTFESDLAAQLQSLYALYGNDPSVMAQMNLALGGEDLISLISRIDDAGANGWMAPGAALLLAQSVRSGLSVGSQRWTDGVGRGFAQELYNGAASVHGTNSWTSLAFLFGDEQDNPIGETTTVGLANIADEMERGNPGASAGMYGPGQGIMGPGGFLSLAEAEQAGYDINRLGDWTSRVFSTLGEYPEAAMDWLTSTETDPFVDSPQFSDDPNLSADYARDRLGENRIDYWYGRRDSSLDGFEGLLALWAGAESIPGGPTDASGYSEDAWKQTAKLTHDVIHQLVGEPLDPEQPDEFREGNPHFKIENVTDLGGVKLAEALAPQMPGLIEDPIVSPSGDRPSTGGPIADVNAYGIAVDANGDPVPTRPFANISPRALAEVLGIAGSTSGGAEALAAVINDYQNVLIGATEVGAYAADDAATRLAFTQEVLTGSTHGVDLAAATRHDEAVDAAIGVVETGVGMLPIPGLDKLIGSLGDTVVEKIASEGAGYLRGQLTDAATGAASDFWADSHDEVSASIADGTLSRSEGTQVQIARTLFELGAVDVAPPPSDDPQALFDWVEDNRTAFDRAFDADPNSSLDLERVAGDANARYSLYRNAAEG